jgi:peptide/nickel transport system permease protein
MVLFILKRLALVPPMLVLVSVLAFLLDRAEGGDPAELSLRSKGAPVTYETIVAERHNLGIYEDSELKSYLSWLGRAVRLDFGVSYQTGRSVWTEIRERFPVSVKLALMATFFGLLLGVVLGVVGARFEGSYPDSAVRFLASLGASVPDFCLSLILLYVFGVYLSLVPTVAGGKTQNLILPALAVSPALAAVYILEIRALLIDTRDKLFIKAWEARGASLTSALIFHGLPSVANPIITLAALSFRKMLGGLVACELIFSINGIGKFALDSVTLRDLPVIQGYVVIMALCVILVTLSLDVLASFLDPRLEKESFY